MSGDILNAVNDILASTDRGTYIFGAALTRRPTRGRKVETQTCTHSYGRSCTELADKTGEEAADEDASDRSKTVSHERLCASTAYFSSS